MKKTTDTLWLKCTNCDQIIYKKELVENFKICPKCSSYLRMSPLERLNFLLDKNENGSIVFKEYWAHLVSEDPLNFSGMDSSSSYLSKLKQEQNKTKCNEAAVCGEGVIGSHRIMIAILNFGFMGGSMGSVVGEKITRAIERSLKEEIPILIVSSSGGARMQEGVLSLMQMAKTSAALARLKQASQLVISLICDPTTGGVTASFAMLGDINIAEPKALIAFAGPRVIEQTIRQTLPEGFQQSEFLLKHGMIDCIVDRKHLRDKLITFLNFFRPN